MKKSDHVGQERENAYLSDITKIIRQDSFLLQTQLLQLRERVFAPNSKKELRKFSAGEVAELIGISPAYLRRLSSDGVGPSPEKNESGRRLYTLADIHQLRNHLNTSKYLPARKGGEPLQIIAVTNFKGGSGKTTTSAHLAQYLTLKGFRTLAIDLDPQASLTSLFGIEPSDIKDNKTLYGAIRYDDEKCSIQDVILKTYFSGLDLIPANLELQEFEYDTPQVLAQSSHSNKIKFYSKISDALEEVDHLYDVVVFDCPPSLGYLTLAALCASRSIFLTIHPQMLDVASMAQFLKMTSDILEVVQRAGAKASYDIFKYCVTRFEPNDGPQAQIVSLLRSLFGDRVLSNSIYKSTAISDAGLTKQTLYEITKDSVTRSTYGRALESVNAVNQEIVGLIEQSWGR